MKDTNRVLAYIKYVWFLENGTLDSAAKYYLKASALSKKLNCGNREFKFIFNYTYIHSYKQVAPLKQLRWHFYLINFI